eukprot:TRINITY_DN23075_c0_g1_i1.p1 TRINITY_DN23075_c0_g1~~TRINITY_DN23075_c0_g1_i1.p1  ORF type:complete len:141 (+),score=37.29 TRINITY_DN23075_c0_g1_i1:171-593(+)
MATPGTDKSKWHIIYPIYINSKKSAAEGRRISISKACEDPTLREIEDCCQYLKIHCEPEPLKIYSRDLFEQGRMRVQLKKADGTPVNPMVPNKKVLLMEIARLVPKHPGRQKKQDAAAKDVAGSSGASSKGAGKSGKKKK